MVSKREQSEDTVDETTVCSGWTFEIMGIYRIYNIYGIWLKTWISFVESYPGPVWSCWSPCGVRQDLYKKWGGDQEDGVRLSVNLCCFKFLAIDLHRITNYFPSFCMFFVVPILCCCCCCYVCDMFLKVFLYFPVLTRIHNVFVLQRSIWRTCFCRNLADAVGVNGKDIFQILIHGSEFSAANK